MKVYYYAGGERVAMRVGGSTVYWLLGDHLGSTAVTVETSGTLVAELRYKAWGETRHESGTTPTTYRFTGQRLESSLALYLLGARWYDPGLSRWLSADTSCRVRQTRSRSIGTLT
jgi:RHS repeat-associated protein